MTRRIGIAFMAALAGGVVSLGCGGRAHLSDSYGRATRACRAAQRISKEPAQGTPAGLDSEEAASIHGRYRGSIGATRGRGGDDPGARVLIVEEPDGAPRR